MHTRQFARSPKFKTQIALAATTFLFALSLHAQTYSVIHSFTNTDGAAPFGLTPDGKGNYFGVSALGGGFTGKCQFSGCGNVFELSPDGSGGWTETILY